MNGVRGPRPVFGRSIRLKALPNRLQPYRSSDKFQAVLLKSIGLHKQSGNILSLLLTSAAGSDASSYLMEKPEFATGTASMLLNLKVRSRPQPPCYEMLALGSNLPAEDFVDSHGNRVSRDARAWQQLPPSRT
jgi:hypothetical protein